MGTLTLAERGGNDFGALCSLEECPLTDAASAAAARDASDDGISGSGGHVGAADGPPPMPDAAAVALLVCVAVWALIGAARWLWRVALERSSASARDRVAVTYGASPYGSPSTPPPQAWLRDDPGADALDGYYVDARDTPCGSLLHGSGGSGSSHTAAEPPLLFSLTPPPPPQLPGGWAAASGGGALPYPSLTPYSLGGGGDTGARARSGGGSPSALRKGWGAAGGGGGGGAGRSGRGWDPALLARSAALVPAISSVEGLYESAEFQRHVRASRGRSPRWEREQAAAKVAVYGELRRLDPAAFALLMDRTDMRTYESRPPSRALAAVEYMLEGLAVPLAATGAAVAAAWLGSAGRQGVPWAGYGPLLAWAGLRLWLAARGRASLLGLAAGAYLVYDTPPGPYDTDAREGRHQGLHDEADGGGDGGGDEDDDELAAAADELRCDANDGRGGCRRTAGHGWASLAAVRWHVALAAVEVALAAGSLGLLAVGALVSVLVGRRRQTLAMRALGLRLEVEASRPTTLSPYGPSRVASPRTTPAPGPVLRSFGLGAPGVHRGF